MGNFFVHHLALAETVNIGEGTRVWAFAHILPGAKIGRECNICDHVFIENEVVVGDRVTIKCGVQLWDGVTLENDVFVGPNATFTNDAWPRSKPANWELRKTLVKRGASIGANATILPGLTIGVEAMIGAAAVVTRDVPDGAVVLGNPARVHRWVHPNPDPVASHAVRSVPTGIRNGGQLDELLAGSAKAAPFQIASAMVLQSSSIDQCLLSGLSEHSASFLVIMEGTAAVSCGTPPCAEYVLDTPSLGLFIPPSVRLTITAVSAAARLMLLMSESGRGIVASADDPSTR